jgi:hypothetical protein
MNKKSIDKIDIFTLKFSYSNYLKDIFNLKSLEKFIEYVNNDIKNKKDNIYLLNRLLEYCWYVYIDEIIINKNEFIEFYNKILNERYNKKITLDKLELLVNTNIKSYITHRNNINYHKIILESI